MGLYIGIPHIFLPQKILLSSKKQSILYLLELIIYVANSNAEELAPYIIMVFLLSILESAKDQLLIRKLEAMRLSKGIKVVEPEQGVFD